MPTRFLSGCSCFTHIYILIISSVRSLVLQYNGPSRDAFVYVEWLKEDENFADILVQTSPALNGHAFPKLKLRDKPSFVQVSKMFMCLSVFCIFVLILF